MIILYPIFILISFAFPRNKKIWVFGCYDGYTENTKYFYEHADNIGEFDCYWLANNFHDLMLLKSLKRKAVLKNSLIGYWISSRAYMSFICTGFSDVHRILSLSSKVVHFWHATPIKKVYLDSDYDLDRFGKNKLSRFASRKLLSFLNGRVAAYYASNPFELNIMLRASGFRSEVSRSIGSPRYDVIRSSVNNLPLRERLKNYKKIVLYAPTWREEKKWSYKFNINENEYSEFNNALEKNDMYFFIKSHPLTEDREIISWGLRPSKRILYTSSIGLNDINSLYAYVDLLVTDVSSSIFDFLIFDKPVLIFMPDKNDYVSGRRGIYPYFEEILDNHAIDNWSDFIYQVFQTKKDIPELFKMISSEIKDLVNVNETIYRDIVRRFY
jgi:CDP-glycerol glycerophosphotransferase (TagB/SpsB family)